MLQAMLLYWLIQQQFIQEFAVNTNSHLDGVQGIQYCDLHNFTKCPAHDLCYSFWYQERHPLLLLLVDLARAAAYLPLHWCLPIASLLLLLSLRMAGVEVSRQ
jgi:hypothetical protein